MSGITRDGRFVTVAILLILAAGCSGTQHHATPDSPEGRAANAAELARLALELGSYDEILDSGAKLAESSSAAALELELGRSLTDEESATVRGLMRSVIAEFVTPEIWQDSVTAVYAEHLTADELHTLFEFYASPLGRKVLGMEGMLTEEVNTAVDAALEDRIDEFIGRVDEELAAAFPGIDSDS